MNSDDRRLGQWVDEANRGRLGFAWSGHGVDWPLNRAGKFQDNFRMKGECTMTKYDKERAQIRAKVWLTPRVMRRALASVDRKELKANRKANR